MDNKWRPSIKQHCRRQLKEAGLVAHVALKNTLLTPVHCRKRLQFAMAHTDWTWVDWSIVLGVMSQDSLFFKNDGRVFVRRRAHEAYRNSCVVPTVKFGAGGMTVWGAMSNRGTGFLTPLKGNPKQGWLSRH